MIIIIILAILDLFFSILLLNYIWGRWKKTSRKELIFFSYLYSLYIIMAIYEIIEELIISDKIFTEYMLFARYSLILTAVIASGFSLNLKFKVAVISSLYGMIISILYIIFYFTGLYENDIYFSVLTNIVTISAQILFIPVTIALIYYVFKTRLSSIIGITLATGLLGLYPYFQELLPIYLRGNFIRLLMLILMYCGFKGVFSWWELSREEKIRRGMAVRVEDEEEDES